MTSEKQKISRRVDKNGNVFYENENGQCHRDDGPAVEWADGSKWWYRNEQLHREDGPAVEDANGSKYWYRDGDVHRDDGPAVERADGTKEYWLYGEKCPEVPQILAEREERRKKDEALTHMKGVFNGTIPVETAVISRLKIKPKLKSKPLQL